MFVRVTKNSAGQSYYHIAESYREGGKVRQRIVLSLGRIEDGKVDQLADSLARHTDRLTAQQIAKSLRIEKSYVLGPLLVLERLFESLGVDATLKWTQSQHRKRHLAVRDIVFGLLAARLVRPSSKLAVYEDLWERLYPAMVGPKPRLEHIYRTLDVLAEHKDEIETRLSAHGRNLFNRQVDVVLYDLTTLRFESTVVEPGALRQFGYSKERRSDCTQVVVGLLLDPRGVPLGFEVYPGNTVETATMRGIIEKMTKKLSVRRFIVVADRGLLSDENLEVIRKSGAQFIVGMRIAKLAKKRPELFDRLRFSKVEPDFFTMSTCFGPDRGLVTWSQQRADRDRKTREDILAKIDKKLAHKRVSTKSFVSNSNYRTFLKGIDTGKPELDPEKVARAAERDGFFAIVTNIDEMTDRELWAHYKDLWRIEDAFGELKGTLKARPVFHWTDHRIVGHLTLCFLGLLCEAHMTLAVRDAHLVRHGAAADLGIIQHRPLCAVPGLTELAEVRVLPVALAGCLYWVRTDISGNAAKLLRALHVRIPPNVIKTEGVVAQNHPDAATA
jgi:hypothetical protein